MNISRETTVVSALSSILLENLTEAEDFNSFEQFGVEKCHELLCAAFAQALEAMDEIIFEEKDWRFTSKGFDSRTLLTSAGMVRFKKRRYSSDAGSVYLLDEALDMPSHLKVSPQLTRLAATFALDASYQSAANALSYYMHSGLTRASIKRLLKTNAELLPEPASSDSTETPVIDVEADGCHVNLQRTRAQKAADRRAGITRKRRVKKEVCVFSAYTGKERLSNDVRRRISALHFATTSPAPAAWTEFSEMLDKHFDTDRIHYTNFATDGDDKYLAGSRYLPGQVSVAYDLHHIPTKIAQTLGSDIAREIFATMKHVGFEEGLDILETYAFDLYDSEGDDKYLKLITFFYTHKDSMKIALCYNLGTMEGTIAHMLGSRVKRFGGGWSTGLDPMVRLKAAQASGIEPKLQTRNSSVSLPEISSARNLAEIERSIAKLEQKASAHHKGKGRNTPVDKPMYYHQAKIVHKAKSEKSASYLSKWS
jgi:hypothetical protein